MSGRVYLLSPASCGGRRAAMLFREGASFDLARRVREPAGAPLGEVFAFLSGLYFRGKLAYAQRFAAPPPGHPGALVITVSEGLVSTEAPVTVERLQAWGGIDLAAAGEAFTGPLLRDAHALDRAGGGAVEVVLLGSVASTKYVEPLLEVFGERLRFPSEFVGRGDMSRGGLMLRRVRESAPLTYVPAAGAVRRGARAPKLDPLPRGRREPA